MSASHPLIDAKKQEFDRVVEEFKKDVGTLRGGQASPALIEHIMVEVYGVKTPLVQLGSIAVPEPRMLTVTPWDKNIMKEIERAIATSDVKLMPVVQGDHIRIAIPPLTEESRKQMVKLLKEKLEKARVSLRHVRDTLRDTIVAGERAGDLTEDDRYRVQRLLDERTHAVQKTLDDMALQKEKILLTV